MEGMGERDSGRERGGVREGEGWGREGRREEKGWGEEGERTMGSPGLLGARPLCRGGFPTSRYGAPRVGVLMEHPVQTVQGNSQRNNLRPTTRPENKFPGLQKAR